MCHIPPINNKADSASDACPPLPECLDCGACCFTKNPRLIELLGLDDCEVPAEYVVQEPDGSRHMRMVPVTAAGAFERVPVGEGFLVCAALGRDNLCRIYPRRPFLCREFERGSEECLQAARQVNSPRKRLDVEPPVP